MPGAIPHLIAGAAMYIVGWYYFRSYFDNEKAREKLFLLVVCLVFSFIPDFFLGTYHVFPIFSIEILRQYHILLHLIISPISIAILLILKFKIDIKRGPIWITGLWCIILHIIMDFIIKEGGIWI